MKLRSGTIINFTGGILPKELNDELESKLQHFKALFLGNIEHAKELLKIISKSINTEARFPIKEKIQEIYDINNVTEITPLMGAAGELAWFLVHNPEYHDTIGKQIKNFDLEMPLSGNTEECYE